jgi:hypothetical protein
MEILIIGVFVVALMIYTSTRIKKSAAQAYEEETVETDEFSLVKPEGFLNPIRRESEFAFEAYSKDYGEDDAETIRQGLITVKVFTDQKFAQVCKLTRQSVDQVLSEENVDNRTFWLKGIKTEKDIDTEIYHKIIAENQKVFDLKITLLAKVEADYIERTEKALESFRVK